MTLQISLIFCLHFGRKHAYAVFFRQSEVSYGFPLAFRTMRDLHRVPMRTSADIKPPGISMVKCKLL